MSPYISLRTKFHVFWEKKNNLQNKDAFHIYCSKSSKLHPERAIMELFYCGNTLPLIKLEKLIQISVLIFVLVRTLQRWLVYDKSKILIKLRTF